MKCKYRFRVDGRFLIDHPQPIETRGQTFDFETEGRRVTHIGVVVPLPDPATWPTIAKSETPGIKANLNVPAPDLERIKTELATIQGLLALFGLRSIDLHQHEREWLPESDAEREQLGLHSFALKSEPLPDSAISPAPFDLVARAVIAADVASAIELPLAFFRRGMNDVYDRNYIEAIYDFFFFIETMFGEGKFKTARLREAFLQAQPLCEAIEATLTDPGPMIGGNAQLKQQFATRYKNKSVAEVLNVILDLRGNLHHHNNRRRWHPDIQQSYEVDALVLQQITFQLAFGLAGEFLWAEEVTDEYGRLINSDQP